MADPFTIRIFVPDGDPEGIRIIDRMNWTGTGIVFPRANWPDVRDGLLVYRNFFSEQVRKDLNNGKKVNTTSISIITIFSPLLLGRLSLELSTNNIISLITAIPTLILAVIAIKGYNKIVLNKVNKEQLKIVINTSKLLTDEKIIYPDENRSDEYKISLTHFSDIWSNRYSRITINKPLMYENKYNELMEEVTNYVNNPITPKPIAIALKSFKNHIERPLEQKDDRIEVKNEDTKRPVRKAICSKTACEQTNKLINEIRKWLEDKNIREPNLPELDNKHTKENET